MIISAVARSSVRSLFKQLLIAGVAIAAMWTSSSTVLLSQTATAPMESSLTLLPDGRWLRLGGITSRGVVDTAAVVEDTGRESRLNWRLSTPRAAHTATVLPDGRVLVLGGWAVNGTLQTTYEIVDATTGDVQTFATSAPLRRSHHTATLMLDGSIVVIGGEGTDRSLQDTGTWSPTTGAFDPWNVSGRHRRARHSAMLSAAGDVIVTGGTNSRGNRIATVQRQQHRRKAVLDPAAEDLAAPTTLSETSPVSGATDVALNTGLGLRFSAAIQLSSLSEDKMTLRAPEGGDIKIRLVAAEQGRLVFLRSDGPLEPGTTYTLSIRGLDDWVGQRVASAAFTFTTAGDQRALPGDDDETATEESAWRSLPPLRGRPGEAALSGQVLRLNGRPLVGVKLEIDDQTTFSDKTGRFILTALHSGHRVLKIDGHSASTRATQFGFFEVGVEALADRTSTLPYTIWMTKLDMAHAVTVASPTREETVISTPRLPGLELRIPAGTAIVDDDGHPVTRVSITPVRIDRPPFPLPAGVRVPLYFTIQPGGAYLQNLSGAKARLIYPNASSQPVGTVFNFWNYDADSRGWYVYGQGQVVPPGRQVAPNPGVGIYEFTGAMVEDPSAGPPTGPPPEDPDDPGPAESPEPPDPSDPGGPPNPGPTDPSDPNDGDPVNTATGLFVLTKTDAHLPDVIPIRFNRIYRQNDSAVRPFGIGSSDNYELLLLGNTNPWTFMDMVLPDGGRVHYTRVSSGTGYADAVYEHTATPTRYYKSRIAWNGTAWDLTFKNGTVYTFPNSNGQTAPSNAALVGVRDRHGNKLNIARDTNGHLLKLVSTHGRSLTFTSDTLGRITQMTDHIGRTTQYAYDTSGRLTTVTDPDAGTTQYTYDGSNRMLTLRDRRNIIFLTNEYDTAGRVWRQTRVDNGTYVFSYTVNGSGVVTQTDVTDPGGHVRRVTFNSSGYIMTEVRALGQAEQQTITYARNSNNLVTAITDPSSRQTAFGYDQAGNTTTITRLAGTAGAVRTALTYESVFNRALTATDALNHVVGFAYDGAGNLTSRTDPSGRRITYQHDAAGRLTSVTTPVAGVTTVAFDGADVTSVTDPLGNARSRVTDAAGRTIAGIDPLGRRTSWTYDAIDRLTQGTDRLGGVIASAFDANGNLLSITDPRNKAVTNTYDNLDQPLTRIDPLQQQDAYSFDANGRLQQHTDRNAKATAYAYDALGRMTQITYADSSTTAVTYDAGDRMTQVVDSVYGTISRSYTDLDQLASETTPQGTVSYTYDAAGRRATMTVTGQTAVGYTYDNADHLLSISRGTAVVSFAYDDDGRRVSTTYPNGVVAANTYDAVSRLTSLTFTNGGTTLGDLTYTYDAAGNRTAVGGSLAGTVTPTAVTSATVDAANRLTQWGAATPIYDLAGNLTSDGVNSYTWNARNQLTAISGGTTAAFAYDPFGRRSSRTVGSTTTQYLYDGLNTAQELDAALLPTANLITGLGIDETFVRTDGGGTVSLLADALGSILALTNGSGVIATQYTYGPFGQVNVTGTATTNATEFTGRENDDTGLYYYRARYYSPTLGRFISDDPVGLASGLNATTYVNNNPIGATDPTGLWTIQIGVTVSWTLSVGLGWSGSFGFAFDGEGNIAGFTSTGPQVALGAKGSATGDVLLSSARTITDLSGPFSNFIVGGGYGPSGAGTMVSGDSPHGHVTGAGLSFGGGAGASLASSTTWTNLYPITHPRGKRK
jgi:RHS repeat-associated protein